MMHARISTLIIISEIVLLAAAGCSFTVTVPDQTPVVIVQVADTQVGSTPASGPTLAASVTPVPTLVPSVIPANTLAPAPVPATPHMCSAGWFFTFDARHQSLGGFCPEPVKYLDAVGEDFEGGRVYRYAPDPAYPADQRGTIYIIYNDGEWVTYPDAWDASQPSNDPTLVVPADRYQPVNGIGKVWREVPEVRSRLGWAYEPQTAFQGRFQSYVLISNAPTGDSHYYFIDHGKWNLALLLKSVDMGPNKWEVVGKY